eukprot:scaffold79712_cov17-Tisochrysis_lutea.AAC.2
MPCMRACTPAHMGACFPPHNTHRQLKPIAGVEKSIRATLLLLISPFSVAAALAALVVIDAREGWDGRLPLAQ